MLTYAELEKRFIASGPGLIIWDSWQSLICLLPDWKQQIKLHVLEMTQAWFLETLDNISHNSVAITEHIYLIWAFRLTRWAFSISMLWCPSTISKNDKYIENRREGGIITLRSLTTDSAIKVVALSNSQAITQFLSLSMENIKTSMAWGLDLYVCLR